MPPACGPRSWDGNLVAPDQPRCAQHQATWPSYCCERQTCLVSPSSTSAATSTPTAHHRHVQHRQGHAPQPSRSHPTSRIRLLPRPIRTTTTGVGRRKARGADAVLGSGVQCAPLRQRDQAGGALSSAAVPRRRPRAAILRLYAAALSAPPARSASLVSVRETKARCT